MNIINSKDLKTQFLSVLIYARPGMGKTTLLGKLPPKTLIIDVDRGTNVLAGSADVDIIRLSDDLHEMPEIFTMLNKKCEYKNVAIDSISELERAMLTYFGFIGKNDGVPSIDAYNRVDNKIQDYCRKFRTLPCNVFFTAWEKLREVTDSSGEKYTLAYPMLRDKSVETICGLCDIIGHIAVEDGERVVALESTRNAIAKDRIFKRKACKFEEIIK